MQRKHLSDTTREKIDLLRRKEQKVEREKKVIEPEREERLG